MSVIVGIDPGASGAIAILLNGKLLSVVDTPQWDGEIDAIAVADIINSAQPRLVVIEKAQSMPKQGVASTFKYGCAYGTVCGVVQTLRHPLVKVTPMQWKKTQGLIGRTKDESRALATQLWPGHAMSFRNKKDHGRAEAALIARHGLTMLLQEAAS
jgi:hypothetical protein